MTCEWDENKNTSNIDKHGLSFEQASQIFDGPVLTRLDTRFPTAKSARSPWAYTWAPCSW
ncbi:MAG: BrnT family toxin [Rhodothermales bacterium]